VPDLDLVVVRADQQEWRIGRAAKIGHQVDSVFAVAFERFLAPVDAQRA
jgi:hypothetical protein